MVLKALFYNTPIFTSKQAKSERPTSTCHVPDGARDFKAPIQWTEEAEREKQDLIDTLTSEPIMGHVDICKDEHPLILTCDTSKHGIGATLSQFQDNKGGPTCVDNCNLFCSAECNGIQQCHHVSPSGTFLPLPMGYNYGNFWNSRRNLEHHLGHHSHGSEQSDISDVVYDYTRLISSTNDTVPSGS